MIPTHGQMGCVLVEVVGGAPHDVQVAAGPRDPVVGRPRAPVPSEKKITSFFLQKICFVKLNKSRQRSTLCSVSAYYLVNIQYCQALVPSPQVPNPQVLWAILLPNYSNSQISD